MNAVFLVGSYVPHQILSINSLIDFYKIKIFSFSVSKKYTYIPKETNSFKTYLLHDYTRKTLLEEIQKINPDLIVTAGWMIPEYNWVCKKMKKRTSIPIVACSDTPWYGTWKQRINAFISPFYLKKAFTHIWVAGMRQYDYARKLKFVNAQILFHSLCGDMSTFSKVDITTKKTKGYPKNFLYVGRYTEIKGLRNLIKAWSSIPDKKGWTFTLIGAGEMKQNLMAIEDFIVKDYMAQDELIEEFQNAGCFVLPSIKEPWALVIHEAAIAGLPILCTETCGASPHFVINNFNGFRVCDNSINDLKKKLMLIMDLDVDSLLTFCNNSRALSTIITPQIQSASLMQLLNEKKQ
ncbi:glycosyltransferase [Massilibacteroides sp.]|uniref:glycosyltransferase n=1 Tax=Massilibacteroides sp. TaxID=2034766 RepID=UPI002617B6FB|nr:glycosyltransferase [Massilibacteroides sp.]MDD4515972.1 glycosyltransferase [Massilibacteroides sp.]